jgi:hypothetical protein
VLRDERERDGQKLDRTAALAELALRYFASRGPATLQDFVWWSGLTTKDARTGLDEARTRLESAVVSDRVYWHRPGGPTSSEPPPAARLLPAFDEYYLAYRERSPVLDPGFDARVVSVNGVFRPIVLIDGQVMGVWKALTGRSAVVIRTSLFTDLPDAGRQAVAYEAGRYAAYLGLPASGASVVHEPTPA